MSEAEAAPDRVDILVFSVGDRTYGADATQVLRIDRRDGAPALAALGPLNRGVRALVVVGPEGEARVPVDEVLGIRQAAVADLRRVPSSAPGHACAVGFWLDRDAAVVLIDLIRALAPQRH